MNDVAFLTHALQGLALSVVVGGPAALAVALVVRSELPVVERWLAAATGYAALQVTVGLALGATGLFSQTPLLVVTALEAAVAAWLLRGRPPRVGAPHGPWPEVAAGALMLLVTAAGVGAWDVLVHPTRNFDSLAYHLPVMARWVQSGHLEIVEGLGQVGLYPSHYELLATLPHLVLHEDLLVGAAQLFAWLWTALATAALARRAGASLEAAMVAAAALMLAPAVFTRLDAVQPDLWMAALSATGLVFLRVFLQEGTRAREAARVVLWSVMALLAGSKLSGPLFVLLLLAAGAVMAPGGFGARLRTVAGLFSVRGDRRSVLVAGVASGLAGAWYLRNLLAVGNPLGDVRVEGFGMVLLQGSIDRATLMRGALARVFDPASEADWRILVQVVRTALGTVLGLTLVAGLLDLSWRAPDAPRTRRVRRALGFFALAAWILYWRTPYGADNGTHGWRITPWMENGLRYAFPALAVSVAGAARGLDRFRGLPALGLAVTVLSGAWTIASRVQPRLAVLGVAVSGGLVLGAVALRGRWPAAGRRSVLGLAGICIVAWALAHPARTAREAERVRAHGEVLAALERSVPEHGVVAVVHSSKLAVAAGKAWTRRVILPELPSPEQTEAEWVRALRRAHVDALLLGNAPMERVGSGEDREAAALARVQEWVRRPQGSFRLVLDYENLRKDLALFLLEPAR